MKNRRDRKLFKSYRPLRYLGHERNDFPEQRKGDMLSNTGLQATQKDGRENGLPKFKLG